MAIRLPRPARPPVSVTSRFREAPAPALAGEPPSAGVMPAVDYRQRELELWQRYGEWLEGQIARRSDELSTMEGHYRNLEAHALGLQASVGRKGQYIADLERELRALRGGLEKGDRR